MGDPFRFPPPSRHAGSRLVAKSPDLIRAVAGIRANGAAAQSRVRREDVAFTEASAAAGVACTSASFIQTHVTMVYRTGHSLFADIAAGTGAGSVLEIRLTVPDLSLTGAAVASATGGTDVDVRVELALPDAWTPGDPHRVFVEGRRLSGADATTIRVLRAWQR